LVAFQSFLFRRHAERFYNASTNVKQRLAKKPTTNIVKGNANVRFTGGFPPGLVAGGET
jgi:hypothetical protein